MKRIKEFFITGLLVILLILTALWALIKTPFHYISYKRSHYYRDHRRKYTLFVCTNPNYRMYNLIRQHDLPIQFIYENAADPIVSGYFVYKNTVLLHDFQQVQYREDLGRWVFRQSRGNTDEPMQVFAYAMDALLAVKALPGHEECSQMLLLLNRRHILKADLPRAERDRRFLLHNGTDLADILSAYIITHPKG